LTICLKFRRLITEGAFDAFAQLKFHPRCGALEVGKPLPSEIFQFREEGL
jgi:hypothetical protein